MAVLGTSSGVMARLWSSMGPSSGLVAGTCGGRGGLTRLLSHLVTFVMATISFALDFGGDRGNRGAGECGIGKLRGLDDRWVREEGRGGGKVTESYDRVV